MIPTDYTKNKVYTCGCGLSLEDVEIQNSPVGRSQGAIRTRPEDGRERGSCMAESSGKRVIFHVGYAKLA